MYITCILRGRIVTKSDEVFRNPKNKKSHKYWLLRDFLKNIYNTICAIKTYFKESIDRVGGMDKKNPRVEIEVEEIK